MPLVDLNNTEDLSGLQPLWEAVFDGYRYVLFSGNMIQVFKGDAFAYQIDEHGCSCPAAQFGNANCKHRSTFSWIGEGTTKNTEVAVSVDGLL